MKLTKMTFTLKTALILLLASGCGVSIRPLKIARSAIQSAVRIAIASPAQNTYINSANVNALGINGTCSQPDQPVSIALTSGVQSVLASATCTTALNWSAVVDVSSLGDGNINLEVSHQSGTTVTSTSIELIKTVTLPPAPILSGSGSGSDSTPDVIVGGLIPGNSFEIFSDVYCLNPLGSGVASGASVTLTSAAITENTPYYARQVNSAGNVSPCSSTRFEYTFTPLRIIPSDFSFPLGQALTQTFSAVGGSGTGYTFSVVSGPGTIGSPALGDYTGGARSAGTATIIRVTDSDGSTSLSTITHNATFTNGTIRALANDGSSLYIGGDFTAIHPYTAIGVTEVSATTGAAVNISRISSGFNPGANIVAQLISGDFIYLAGAFTSYRGVPVRGVAKISLSTGHMDTAFSRGFDPYGVGLSLAISPDGKSLYVGGNFNSYRGKYCFSLMKVDTFNGDLDKDFNIPDGPDHQVAALAISADGSTLYAGGYWTSYRSSGLSGLYGRYLVKIDTTTGAMDTVNFNTTPGPNYFVYALALSADGASLYVGGQFTDYRGDTNAKYLAKVNAATGVLDTTFNSTVGPNNVVYTLALSSDGGSLYVGGLFSTYRTAANGKYLAKVDASTGALDVTFNSQVGPSSTVRAIAVEPGGANIYVGGLFINYRGNDRIRYLAKLTADTGVADTAGFNSMVGPPSVVYSICFKNGGTSVFAAGDYTFYGGIDSRYLAKFSRSTWQADSTFSAGGGPNAAVYALTLSSDYNSLYVGGAFTDYRLNANGKYLAKVSALDGALDTLSFNTVAGPNAIVYALQHSSDGGSLFVGGSFSSYRTVSNGRYLAKVSAASGALDTATFNTTIGPSGTVNALALTPSGTELFVGGSFSNYRTVAEGKYLAKVNANTGVLDTSLFNTVVGPATTVSAIAVSPDGSNVYIGGWFVNYRGDANGKYLAKLDASTGVMDADTFNSQIGPNSGVNALQISSDGSQIYAGGDFPSYRGAVNGRYLAKISAATGTLDAAAFNSMIGAVSPVYALSFLPDESQLFVGGAHKSYRSSPFGFFTPIIPSTGAVLW